MIKESSSEPVQTYCCGYRLLPCLYYGADVWESCSDNDHGDLSEKVFECGHCGNRIYVKLPY